MALTRPVPIILEIGEAYTKAGFAGESKPRAIFQTRITLDEEQDDRLLVTIGVNGLKKEKWVRALQPFLRDIYFRHLAVNPTERKVVVLENPFWPLPFKDALVAVLFELQVPGVKLLPIDCLPIYLSGKESGLVVDVGYAETRVQPVGEGFPLIGTLKSIPVGMRTVHDKFLLDNAKAIGAESLGWAYLENAVVRTAVVRPLSDDERKLKAQNKLVHVKDAGKAVADVSFPILGGKALTIAGASRSMCAETLFGLNEEGFNIAHILLDALLKCDKDVRAGLAANVVLCGGTVALPGFQFRLLDEVYCALALPKYAALRGLNGKLALFDSPHAPNIMAWLGGGIVGSLDLADEEFLSKVVFDKNGVPDWSRVWNGPAIAVTGDTFASAATRQKAGVAQQADEEEEEEEAEEEEAFLF